MFVLGGMDMERGFLDDFYAFNIAEGTWEQVQATGTGPTPRDKSAVCVVGKYARSLRCALRPLLLVLLTTHHHIRKLYFFGGFGPVEAEVAMPERSGQGSEDGDDDDEEEDEYDDEGPAMSFNWFDDLFVYDTGTRVCLEGLAWLVSWIVFSTVCARAAALWSSENNSWEQVTTQGEVPSPRAAFGMDVVGSSIYVFGGRDTAQRQNDTYVVRATVAQQRITRFRRTK
jgi:amphiphysin